MNDTAPAPFTLGWCPGCDTHAPPHTIVTGEYIDQQMGNTKPVFGGGPFPAMCVHCWKGFHEATARAANYGEAKALAQQLLNRVRAHTAAREAGKPGRWS